VIVDVIKYVLLPSKVIAVLFAVGAALLFARRSVRTGKVLVIAAVLLLFLFGSGVVTWWLLGRLEYRYPAVTGRQNGQDVTYIVVLAGYAATDKDIPVSSRVNSSAAFRILETARLQTVFPKSRILITGFTDVPRVMKDLSVAIGIPEDRIIVDDRSKNTYESAVNVQPIVKNRRFALVTSAGHMPRAMDIFRRIGMDPIPAPTDYRTYRQLKSVSFLPSPSHLQSSDLIIHEYLGMLWYKIFPTS